MGEQMRVEQGVNERGKESSGVERDIPQGEQGTGAALKRRRSSP